MAKKKKLHVYKKTEKRFTKKVDSSSNPVYMEVPHHYQAGKYIKDCYREQLIMPKIEIVDTFVDYIVKYFNIHNPAKSQMHIIDEFYDSVYLLNKTEYLKIHSQVMSTIQKYNLEYEKIQNCTKTDQAIKSIAINGNCFAELTGHFNEAMRMANKLLKKWDADAWLIKYIDERPYDISIDDFNKVVAAVLKFTQKLMSYWNCSNVNNLSRVNRQRIALMTDPYSFKFINRDEMKEIYEAATKTIIYNESYENICQTIENVLNKR